MTSHMYSNISPNITSINSHFYLIFTVCLQLYIPHCFDISVKKGNILSHRRKGKKCVNVKSCYCNLQGVAKKYFYLENFSLKLFNKSKEKTAAVVIYFEVMLDFD